MGKNFSIFWNTMITYTKYFEIISTVCKPGACKRRGAKNSTFLVIFCGFLIFSGELHWKTLKLTKSPIFTNTPCKSTCLYNAPSLHIVDICCCVDDELHAQFLEETLLSRRFRGDEIASKITKISRMHPSRDTIFFSQNMPQNF